MFTSTGLVDGPKGGRPAHEDDDCTPIAAYPDNCCNALLGSSRSSRRSRDGPSAREWVPASLPEGSAAPTEGSVRRKCARARRPVWPPGRRVRSRGSPSPGGWLSASRRRPPDGQTLDLAGERWPSSRGRLPGQRQTGSASSTQSSTHPSKNLQSWETVSPAAWASLQAWKNSGARSVQRNRGPRGQESIACPSAT